MSKNHVVKKLAKNEEAVQPATIGEGTVVTESTEAYLLEQHLNEERAADPAGWAATQLESFELTVGAQSLLDRSMDNMSRNNGAGLEDEDARVTAQLRASLVTSAGNDIRTAVLALSESVEDPIEAAGMIQSLLFNALKGAVFIGNLDYRQFLDATGDRDLHLYIGAQDPRRGEDGNDPREMPAYSPDRREDISPLDGQAGFESVAEYKLARAKQLYGADIEDECDVVVGALNDLRTWCQLTAESFGWSAEQPMPFAFVQELNGTFTPITDAKQALDIVEVRRQASRAKRRAKQGAAMSAAAARARETLLKAAARK